MPCPGTLHQGGTGAAETAGRAGICCPSISSTSFWDKRWWVRFFLPPATMPLMMLGGAVAQGPYFCSSYPGPRCDAKLWEGGSTDPINGWQLLIPLC